MVKLTLSFHFNVQQAYSLKEKKHLKLEEGETERERDREVQWLYKKGLAKNRLIIF